MDESVNRVLCIDEEKSILHSLRRLFRREKCRVFTATNGAEALKLLEEDEVHLVMCDKRLSDMDCAEFLSLIKKRYPNVVRTVLSTHMDMDSLADLVNKGSIHKFFWKPWDDEELRSEIRTALQHHNKMYVNKRRREQIAKENEDLKKTNEDLEVLLQQRTRVLEIRNQALEILQGCAENQPPSAT